MTDTGTSCAYAPTSVYYGLLDLIFTYVNVVAYDSYGYPLMDCNDLEKLPFIEFLFGGYWMQMLPEDYMIPDSVVILKNGQTQYRCGLCLDDNGEESWLLGDAFLRGFYSVYDHAGKQFGFAPHSLSKKNAPVKGEVPSASQSMNQLSKQDTTTIILIVVGAVAAVGIVILVIVIKPTPSAKAVPS